MADGLLIGQTIIGPNTMAGKRAIGEILEVELVANTDYVVKVPPEAVAYALSFTFNSTGAATEVKVGSNLIATTSGMPIPAQGWMVAPIFSSITELKLKAVSPPAAFNLTFI
jgi:hypothetical protein